MGHSTIIPARHWLQAWSAGELRARHWQQALLALATGAFLYCLLSALNNGQPFHAVLALGWGVGVASAMGLGVLAYRRAQSQWADRTGLRRAAIAAVLLLLPLLIAVGERWLAAAYWGGPFTLDWSHYHGRWPMALLLLVVLELPGWLKPGASPGPRAEVAPPLPDTAPSAAPPVFEVSTRAGPRRIAAAVIEEARAAGNYVELSAGGQTFLLRETLSRVETQLAAHGFVRVHRSHLVRVDAVRACLRRPRGNTVARLASGSEVPVGRAFRESLRRALEQASSPVGSSPADGGSRRE